MTTKLQAAENRFKMAVAACTRSYAVLDAAQKKITRVLAECKNPHKSRAKATAICAALDAIEECEETSPVQKVVVAERPDPSKTRFRLKPA